MAILFLTFILVFICYYQIGDRMKLQVRVFDEEHESVLEDEINEFLKEIEPHSFIDIKYDVHAFLSSTGEQIYLYSALVIYRDDEEYKKDIKKKLFKK